MLEMEKMPQFGENALERKALAGKLWRGGTKPGLAWVRPTGLGCTTELKPGVDRFGKKTSLVVATTLIFLVPPIKENQKV